MKLSLVFGAGSGIGGSERRMVDLAVELGRRGWTVTAFIPRLHGAPLAEALASVGARVVPYHGPLDLVRRVARERAFATWVFGARASFPLLAARPPRVFWRGGKLMVAKNGLDANKSPRATRLEIMLLARADLVVANSRSAGLMARQRLRVPDSKVRVLPSALGDEWGESPPREARRRVRIAMIGNNRPEKQHALGVKLFVDQADPEAVLTVYTNDGRALKQQVDRLSARDASRVSVLEGVEVTPALMRTIDVLLHPASSESLPRVALEARSQSAWVVGFDVGDLADFCETRVPFGALPEISDSLRRACESVRQGKWPEPLTPMTVPEYADRLLALCGQP